MATNSKSVNLLAAACIAIVCCCALYGINALAVPSASNDQLFGPPSSLHQGFPRPLGIRSGNPESGMNTTQLLTYYGYPSEIHEVTTRDGYILMIHRIPHGRNNSASNETKPVIFLQHGLLAASDSWIMNAPEESLATLLADLGYDVWMGNFRGNYYNHRHIVYPNTSLEFWTFSFDEMGRYDLPAMVGKALEVTNQSQLILIAHSQGTTASFISLSTNVDDFAKKIKLGVMLAPIIYVDNIQSPLLQALSKISYDLTLWFNIVGYYDFLPENRFTRWFASHVCPTWGWGEICDHLVFLISGYDKYMFNHTRSDVYASHFPAGTSSMDMAHFAQCVKSAKFGRFDWGSKAKNIYHYGTPEPPLYHPENVTTPIALFQAQNDWLAPIADVLKLKNVLPNVVLDYMVPYASFNHVDFVLGTQAKFFVYNELFDLLKKYVNVTTTTPSSAESEITIL